MKKCGRKRGRNVNGRMKETKREREDRTEEQEIGIVK
jgi:hypothetical protein